MQAEQYVSISDDHHCNQVEFQQHEVQAGMLQQWTADSGEQSPLIMIAGLSPYITIRHAGKYLQYLSHSWFLLVFQLSSNWDPAPTINGALVDAKLRMSQSRLCTISKWSRILLRSTYCVRIEDWMVRWCKRIMQLVNSFSLQVNQEVLKSAGWISTMLNIPAIKFICLLHQHMGCELWAVLRWWIKGEQITE